MSRLLEATYRVEQTHFWFRGLARFVRPLIERAVAGRVHPDILDCGCGTGANMKMLSAYGRVTGFDITFAGPVFARTYAQTRLAQASVVAIPFADATFDFVTAFDVLQSLHDDEETQALAEMRRVLKPGGFLMINTAALRFLRGQHAVFGSEVRRSTRRELRARLEGAGFTIARLTYTNFTLLPFMIPVRVTQRIVGLSTPEETGADISIPPAVINGALEWLVTVESVALRYVNMPIGSSLLARVCKA